MILKINQIIAFKEFPESLNSFRDQYDHDMYKVNILIKIMDSKVAVGILIILNVKRVSNYLIILFIITNFNNCIH